MVEQRLDSSAVLPTCDGCGHCIDGTVVYCDGRTYHWDCYETRRHPKHTDRVTCPQCGHQFTVEEGATVTLEAGDWGLDGGLYD